LERSRLQEVLHRTEALEFLTPQPRKICLQEDDPRARLHAAGDRRRVRRGRLPVPRRGIVQVLSPPDGGENLAFYAVLGFISGFSERFAQDVIAQASRDPDQKAPKPKPAGT
jgi:hypothetical protein